VQLRGDVLLDPAVHDLGRGVLVQLGPQSGADVEQREEEGQVLGLQDIEHAAPVLGHFCPGHISGVRLQRKSDRVRFATQTIKKPGAFVAERRDVSHASDCKSLAGLLRNFNYKFPDLTFRNGIPRSNTV